MAQDDDGIGANQEFINRWFGRYLKHSAAGTDWVDPTLAPELVCRVSPSGTYATLAAHADGDPSDAGSVSASSPHTYLVEFSNTGNYPLSIGIPVASGATNCSVTNTPMSLPLIVMPGHSRLVTVEVTDGGAGAYDVTLTFETNDSSEATYEIDFIGTAA
jgi:hypothetical protein